MTVTYRSCDSKRKIGIGFFLKTEIEILIEAIINFTFSNEIILEKLKKIIWKYRDFREILSLLSF